MNERSDSPQTSETSILPPVLPAEIPSRAKPFSHWVTRFLACNPFYLVSAALLLYGFYRISVDPGFVGREVAQLGFNFTSLQFYEGLLVVTAVFLARRSLWYDSTLLVWLENLLVLVPFMLISQAGLINPRIVWVLSVLAGLVAVARFGALQRFLANLRFPGRLSCLGLIALAVNVALPIVYRILHEHKFGTKPDWGAAYHTNQYIWWLLLPGLCLLMNGLFPSRRSGERLESKHWLWLGFFSLWLVGSGVHLYSLGYIYDFNLRADMLAPAVWVLVWGVHLRLPEILPGLAPAWRSALLVPPLLASFLAVAQPGHGVFPALTLLNAGLYGVIVIRRREQKLARHLLAISLLALVGALPEEWGQNILAGFTRAKAIGAGAVAYFLLWAVFSRDPKLSLFAALVAGATVTAVLRNSADALHWGLQAGLVFLLLHSLRWRDDEEPGAAALRGVAGLIWVAHSGTWMHLGGAAWVTCTTGATVLAVYLVARWAGGSWGPIAVPLAALLVLFSGPADFAASHAQTAPTGLLAIIASFALFGLGTLAALNRHRWSKTE